MDNILIIDDIRDRDFDVIKVEFASGIAPREFAARFPKPHKLNQPVLVGGEEEFVSPEKAMAEHGGGHYYFIQDTSSMAKIFSSELETLLSTVARNASLKLQKNLARVKGQFNCGEERIPCGISPGCSGTRDSTATTPRRWRRRPASWAIGGGSVQRIKECPQTTAMAQRGTATESAAPRQARTQRPRRIRPFRVSPV